MTKLEFVSVVKEVRSYASMSGDKTFTIQLKGEDTRMMEAIAMPGDKTVIVTIEVDEKSQ